MFGSNIIYSDRRVSPPQVGNPQKQMALRAYPYIVRGTGLELCVSCAAAINWVGYSHVLDPMLPFLHYDSVVARVLVVVRFANIVLNTCYLPTSTAYCTMPHWLPYYTGSTLPYRHRRCTGYHTLVAYADLPRKRFLQQPYRVTLHTDYIMGIPGAKFHYTGYRINLAVMLFRAPLCCTTFPQVYRLSL